jgi:hypothetical protein
MMKEETLVPVDLDRIIDSLLSSPHCFLARNLYMWLPWLGAKQLIFELEDTLSVSSI